MKRSYEPEIMDEPNFPEESMEAVHASLAKINKWLGNIRVLVNLIKKDSGTKILLDIGCGTGKNMRAILEELPNLRIKGVELRLPKHPLSGLGITQADATRDKLPICDVAVAIFMTHHLTEDELVAMIRNIGLYCKRLIILDVVRHPLPLLLFKLFIAPWLSSVSAADGAQSVRRSYTPCELNTLVTKALDDGLGSFTQTIAPLYIRQTIEIIYKPLQ